MTAHELAKQLLGGPDLPVQVLADVQGWNNIGEVEVAGAGVFADRRHGGTPLKNPSPGPSPMRRGEEDTRRLPPFPSQGRGPGGSGSG